MATKTARELRSARRKSLHEEMATLVAELQALDVEDALPDVGMEGGRSHGVGVRVKNPRKDKTCQIETLAPGGASVRLFKFSKLRIAGDRVCQWVRHPHTKGCIGV